MQTMQTTPTQGFPRPADTIDVDLSNLSNADDISSSLDPLGQSFRSREDQRSS
jgi:hypothetical protein